MLRQKGQVSRDFMEVVPSVVIVEDLYKCKVDRDKDYDQMDQEGKVTSLDPCNHGFSMDKSHKPSCFCICYFVNSYFPLIR